MRTIDGDTYYINVTFSRSLSADADVVENGTGPIVTKTGEATDAQLLAQFATELQSAYGLEVGMAGHYNIHSLNGAPLTDEQKEAIMKAIDKEVESW